jgi:Txe/YoeB family toxin of Txe-Axe toxin-antitoxin module
MSSESPLICSKPTLTLDEVEYRKKVSASPNYRVNLGLTSIFRNKISVAPESGKALAGDLKGYFSRRLSFQDRIVYRIENVRCVVVVIRAKTHYGD